jgi:hypothetical protein
VGDSEAWLIEDGVVLTEGQQRKPLLGTGAAKPVAFEAKLAGTLLVASDGLFKYARKADILAHARLERLDDAIHALTDAVRLPSGQLQDDVAIVACR